MRAVPSLRTRRQLRVSAVVLDGRGRAPRQPRSKIALLTRWEGLDGLPQLVRQPCYLGVACSDSSSRCRPGVQRGHTAAAAAIRPLHPELDGSVTRRASSAHL